jgi:hypothetical protein
MDGLGGYDTFPWKPFWCVISILGEAIFLTCYSSSNPSGLGISQREHRTKPNSRCSHVQHVCPSVSSSSSRMSEWVILLTLYRGSIIATNIYREDDAPQYTRGNTMLLGLACLNIGLYTTTKLYYVLRNKYRQKKWDKMSDDEQFKYLSTTRNAGNKRLDFKFAS